MMHERSKYKKNKQTRVWKRLIPSLMADVKRFNIFAEQVSSDVVETARELKTGPEYVPELLQSQSNINGYSSKVV